MMAPILSNQHHAPILFGIMENMSIISAMTRAVFQNFSLKQETITLQLSVLGSLGSTGIPCTMPSL
jgi:hypothetical protein